MTPTLIACCLAAAAAAGDYTVPLPPGATLLADIGLYRIGYQSGDRPPAALPDCWAGHFESHSGVSYVPHEYVSGRDAILLHCPWRIASGPVWIAYRLALPHTKPIELAFGIAMRPDVAEPGKSDGVTFSVRLETEGKQEELMRLHYSQALWRDYAFDLTPYAGQTVTLKLQAEPGPDGNAGWDYSYFSNAVIRCGDAQTSTAGRIDALASRRAYRALEGADLAALANDPSRGITPSNALSYANRIERGATSVRFHYDAEDARIQYLYLPKTGTLDDFYVHVDDEKPFQPALGGGVSVVVEQNGAEQFIRASQGRLVRLDLDPDKRRTEARWAYDVAGVAFEVLWTFAIEGKALLVTANCEEPVLGQLSLGHVGQAPLRTTLRAPYLWGSLSYLPAQALFACRYLDWTQSNASRCPQGQAVYEPTTAGARNPLFETGYIAVSPCVHEVLPNLPHPPSPYRELLGPRILLDIWGHHDNTYQGDAENLRNLKDHGVDHLAIISHVWQCYGYDVKLPDHLPANPQFGGDEGMKTFGQVANECGYVWSLHENYIDLYPDAPSYDASAAVLRADGSKSPAWFNKGTGVQSYGLKCNRALDYAKQNSPEIHRRFNTNAAYLDVHSCVPPWHQLDHDASQPMAAIARHKVLRDAELFQFERDAHGGPLFGEGNNHFYWAGLCDGVEAQVNGGEDHQPFLDFDLLKIHPQMVNHGMGYYERWFRRGYSHQWGLDTGTPQQVDKYRAMEVAYGHAGFIGNAQTSNVQWVAKEHHLMHPVQRLYGAAKVRAIHYEIDGRFVTADIALPLNRRHRQRIAYDTGLVVHVNWAPEPWPIEGHTLPQWGFLATGPGTTVYTALVDGHYADYADCPEFLFADARTCFNMPYLDAETQIEPSLARFEHLGGARIRLTYAWQVGEALEDDYHCFVHFLNDDEPGADHIAFQNDHALPQPTSQWQPGATLEDGPHDITLPGAGYGYYDIVIGLVGHARVPLRGLTLPGNRILIGRLAVERQDGRITSVKRVDIVPPDTTQKADFNAHMNPPGTFIDFGLIATNGSVKVERRPDHLLVLPYPRGNAFTVALDIARIAPHAGPAAVCRVQALAPHTRAVLEPIPTLPGQDKLTFRTSCQHAAAYRIDWPGVG